MQRIFEIARQQSGKAVARQKKAHMQKRLHERILQTGDWVWQHWPPGTSKVTRVPFSGPYKILDVKKDQSGVLLDLPACFRGTEAKWCNLGNIKPVVFMKDGHLFIVMPPEFADDVNKRAAGLCT